MTGLREVNAALQKFSRDAPKVVTDELKTAGAPVERAAAVRVSRYRGTTQTFKTKVKSRGSVFVYGTARKRGGKRGDFGLLQQLHLEAALDENQDKVRQELEDAFDRLISSTF